MWIKNPNFNVESEKFRFEKFLLFTEFECKTHWISRFKKYLFEICPVENPYYLLNLNAKHIGYPDSKIIHLEICPCGKILNFDVDSEKCWLRASSYYLLSLSAKHIGISKISTSFHFENLSM